ncbi:hypothetical protein MW344_004793 [Vibrio parahaemolyticus]|nr:hypothetical protein [Vibrio parahaemolyticus]
MSHTISAQINLEFTPDMVLVALAYQSLYGLDNFKYVEDETPQGLKNNISSACIAFVEEFGLSPLKDINHDLFSDDLDFLKFHMKRSRERIIKIIPDFFV